MSTLTATPAMTPLYAGFWRRGAAYLRDSVIILIPMLPLRCCTLDPVLRYRRKISGPLLDRIDTQVEVPAVPPEDLARKSTDNSSTMVRQRVVRARAKMATRQGKENARLTTREIDN